MRRRIATILSILSLLLGVAAIVRRVTISPNDLKDAQIVAFDRLWTAACDNESVQFDVGYPPAEKLQVFGILGEPVVHQFAGLAIGYYRGHQESTYTLTMPWWAIIAVTLVLPAAVGVRRFMHRRKPFGHCPNCGYNLTGNTSGVCPECGTTVLENSKN